MKTSTGRTVRLSRIEFSNIRGFRHQEINLAAGVTVLIGRNGTHKTTILRAIAVNLAGPEDGQALLALPTGGFVTTGADHGEVVVHGSSSRQQATIARSTSGESLQLVTSGDALTGFVCGYGAGRGVVGTDAGRGYRPLDAVASLFDYSRPLVDPELTLRRLGDHLGTDRYDRTLAGIARVLGLGDQDKIELPRGGGVAISGPNFTGPIPLAGWADGYRLTFTWILDLYGWALQADQINDDGHIDGVVLVDEIDQHLHPALQAGVVAQLSELLPTTQIIVTTHSPLVALGVSPDQLVALHRVGDHVEVLDNVPDYRSWSVEDLLTDHRLFGADAHSPEMTAQLEAYQALVAKRKESRSPDEEVELKRLAAQVSEALPAQPTSAAVQQADEEFEALMSDS